MLEVIDSGETRAPVSRVTKLAVPERGTGASMMSGNADAVAVQIASLLAERGLIGA